MINIFSWYFFGPTIQFYVLLGPTWILYLQMRYINLKCLVHLISTLLLQISFFELTRLTICPLISLFLLVYLLFYQVLLRSNEYEKGLLGVHLSRRLTFIFIWLVNLASTSFLTRTDARTHVRKPGKLTYRGGTGPPKNLPALWRQIE